MSDNPVAIITGGSRGVGAAAAKMLSDNGWNVMITCSSSINEAKTVAKNCANEASEVYAFQADVSNNDECLATINKALEKWNRIDALVNNAGTNRPEFFTKIKRKDMSEVVDLNIKASFDIAQLSTKIMLKSKNRKKIGGSIINLSSQLGKVGAPLRSVYNMTKFGIEGLTKGMAIDLAKHNIRVNSICPTFVETPMVKNFFKNKDFKKSVIKNIPLGKVATESDIATAVVYLASDASSMMTGSSLVIDGGWTAK